MEKFFLGDALAYSQQTNDILPLKNYSLTAVSNEEKTEQLFEIKITGMRPIVASGNVRIITKSGFIPIEELSEDDLIELIVAPTKEPQKPSISDEEFWTMGERLASERTNPPTQILSSSKDEISTFVNGFINKTKDKKEWQEFITFKDALFFQMACIKARNAIAEIDEFENKIKIPKHGKKDASMCFQFTKKEILKPTTLFQYEGDEITIFVNGYKIKIGRG